MGQVKDYSDPPYTGSGAEDGEWNVFEINPYIGAFSETYDPFYHQIYSRCGVTRLVACPSADSDFMKKWCMMNCEDQWDFNEPAYSYWIIGGMPTPIYTGNPDNGFDGEAGDHVLQDLTLDTLSPNRLVMSDIMAIDYWGPESSYRYNHGINGWSWMGSYPPGHETNDPYPDATGRNQVFGDGHFEWRAISAEYDDNLPNTEDIGYLEDRWNGAGSGWMNNGDTSYY
jgi:hypothetical protein